MTAFLGEAAAKHEAKTKATGISNLWAPLAVLIAELHTGGGVYRKPSAYSTSGQPTTSQGISTLFLVVNYHWQINSARGSNAKAAALSTLA